MVRRRANFLYLFALIVTVSVTVVFLFTPSAQAASDSNPSATPRSVLSIFNEDLTVVAGERIDDSVVLYGGDARIEAGGAVDGNLSVFGGDAIIAGAVEGNLAITGGNGHLEASARIGGDVSVVGGRVVRAQGAYVGGDYLAGPGGEWSAFGSGANPDGMRSPVNRSPLTIFLWRIIQAVLWTFLISGLVLLISWLTPERLQSVAQTGERETALSFGVGFLVALGVGFLSMLLMLTLCLAPIAVLLIGLLAILGLTGWSVTCFWLGRKVSVTVKSTTGIPPLVWTGLVSLILTGVAGFAWALLPCLGAFVALLIGSPGVGAILVHLSRSEGVASEPELPSAPTDPQNDSSDGAFEDLGTDIENEDRAHEVDESEEAERNVDSGEIPPVSSELSTPSTQHREVEAGDSADDLRRIRGIGPTFELRLRQGGIERYAQLASLTPDELSAILGWPTERIIRDGLIEQAERLARDQRESE